MMWNEIKKKVSGNALKILNEKEIQEKLYGEYRTKKPQTPVSILESDPSAKSNHPSHTLDLKPEEGKPGASGTKLHDSWQKMETALQDSIRRVRASQEGSRENKPERIPDSSHFWKWAIAAFLTVLAVPLAIQVSRQIRSRQENPSFSENEPALTQNVSAGPKAAASPKNGSTLLHPDHLPKSAAFQDVQDGALVTKKESHREVLIKKIEAVSEKQAPPKNLDGRSGTVHEESKTTQTTEAASLANIPPANGKAFTIQICTYRTETDARKLIARLEAFKLPAYYQIVPSKQSGSSKFYLVLIGQDPSYSDAQNRLLEFKQLAISKEFPDSYIRRR